MPSLRLTGVYGLWQMLDADRRSNKRKFKNFSYRVELFKIDLIHRMEGPI